MFHKRYIALARITTRFALRYARVYVRTYIPPRNIHESWPTYCGPSDTGEAESIRHQSPVRRFAWSSTQPNRCRNQILTLRCKAAQLIRSTKCTNTSSFSFFPSGAMHIRYAQQLAPSDSDWVSGMHVGRDQSEPIIEREGGCGG